MRHYPAQKDLLATPWFLMAITTTEIPGSNRPDC
jgi:hypothetical protein